MDKLLLRPTEAGKLLSISRSKTYQLIAAGVLPSVRIGSSVRVPAARLQAWIEQHTTGDGEGLLDPPNPGGNLRVR